MPETDEAKYLKDLLIRIQIALSQAGSIGVVMGILLAREILFREGPQLRGIINIINPSVTSAVDELDEQNIISYLRRIESGDLILQDQILTGHPYNPEIEKSFQGYAQELLRKYDEAKCDQTRE